MRWRQRRGERLFNYDLNIKLKPCLWGICIMIPAVSFCLSNYMFALSLRIKIKYLIHASGLHISHSLRLIFHDF